MNSYWGGENKVIVKIFKLQEVKISQDFLWWR